MDCSTSWSLRAVLAITTAVQSSMVNFLTAINDRLMFLPLLLGFSVIMISPINKLS